MITNPASEKKLTTRFVSSVPAVFFVMARKYVPGTNQHVSCATWFVLSVTAFAKVSKPLSSLTGAFARLDNGVSVELQVL